MRNCPKENSHRALKVINADVVFVLLNFEHFAQSAGFFFFVIDRRNVEHQGNNKARKKVSDKTIISVIYSKLHLHIFIVLLISHKENLPVCCFVGEQFFYELFKETQIWHPEFKSSNTKQFLLLPDFFGFVFKF